jgi:LPS sulfotransferase NodH
MAEIKSAIKVKKQRDKLIKFCILTTQRSGSTLLQELLDSHSDIKVLREIFLNKKPKNIWADPNLISFYEFKNERVSIRPWITFQYLNKLDAYPGEHKAIGFKLMYNQFSLYPEILLKLIADRFKIIHLVRDNYLDVVFSKINAIENDLFHTRTEVEMNSIQVNPSFLLKKLYQQEMTVKLAYSILKIMPNSVLNISYNCLCDNRGVTLNSVLNFLNISNTEIDFKSSLQKISKGSYKEKIANYDEVYQRLAGTKFKKWLGE